LSSRRPRSFTRSLATTLSRTATSGWPGWPRCLDLNQNAPDIDDHAAFDLVMDAAQGAVEVEEIAARLRVVPGSEH
jgi:hypothetical protein